MFIKLILSKIWFKKLSSFLSILLMAFGTAIILLVLKTSKKAENAFYGNIANIDMVIGAKGSPLQIILSAVFHADDPTGNVPVKALEPLVKNLLIKKMIPISYGDNYQGYRILGSDAQIFEQYKLVINQGNLPKQTMDVVAGAKVAKDLRLKIGDDIESTHGKDKDGEKHAHKHYHIAGILKESGTVMDRLLLTQTESIWAVHDHADEKNYTAVLVEFRSPLGLMTLPRLINEQTNLQAALPNIETDRLLKIFDSVLQPATILAYIIVFISGISVFISLYNSLKEQKEEVALMLSLGASRFKVFTQFLMEGIFISLLGYLLGLVLCYLILYVIDSYTGSFFNFNFKQWHFTLDEIYLGILALIVGTLAAAVPSLNIYKINIPDILAKD